MYVFTHGQKCHRKWLLTNKITSSVRIMLSLECLLSRELEKERKDTNFTPSPKYTHNPLIAGCLAKFNDGKETNVHTRVTSLRHASEHDNRRINEGNGSSA